MNKHVDSRRSVAKDGRMSLPSPFTVHVKIPDALAARLVSMVDGILIKSPAHALVVLASEALDAREIQPARR